MSVNNNGNISVLSIADENLGKVDIQLMEQKRQNEQLQTKIIQLNEKLQIEEKNNESLRSQNQIALNEIENIKTDLQTAQNDLASKKFNGREVIKTVQSLEMDIEELLNAHLDANAELMEARKSVKVVKMRNTKLNALLDKSMSQAARTQSHMFQQKLDLVDYQKQVNGMIAGMIKLKSDKDDELDLTQTKLEEALKFGGRPK